MGNKCDGLMLRQNPKEYTQSKWTLILFLSKSSVAGNYQVGYPMLMRDRLQ